MAASSPYASAPPDREPGDADVAAVASLLAEPARARIVLALADGRALAASLLAAEAGVAPSTASSHLSQLLDGGLVSVTQQGRHRYYRLAGEHVGELVELLARLAPPQPVRSLRASVRARALREGRTCYDHLAGRLGVELFAAMLAAGWIEGGDGRHDPERARGDRPSARGRDLAYVLTRAGARGMRRLGVQLPAADRGGSVALRYCVDWTEQRHHLSGVVGSALWARVLELRWVAREPRGRAVRLTDDGREGFGEALGLEL
jgi:DNA-binding transcriptional ArsR family regulator